MADIINELKKAISEFEVKAKSKNVGVITELGDGVAKADGLSDVAYNELIDLPNNLKGLALNLEESSVGIVIFEDYTKLKEGDEAKSTGKILEVPVGEALLGRIVNSLNNDMNGVQLTGILKKKFKTKVFVENDANCAALAELYYGAGKGKKNFVLLTLGSGIGGGAICDGKLYRGSGGAIEPGSMIIDKGIIFEELASGDASVEIARKEFGLKGVTSLELEERANKEDKKALEVYDRVGYYLGIGLSNLTYLFDPEVLILGGGFSRVKHIYPSMYATFNKLYKLNPKPKIVKARFGDDSGLIGAGLLARARS